MTAEPTISVSLRLPRTVRDLLKVAADEECRSMANMVEFLIVRHCKEHGIGLSAKRPGSKSKARA